MLFQACEALGVEALAPQGDDFTASTQPLSDLVVAQALGGKQDHLGPLHLKIR